MDGRRRQQLRADAPFRVNFRIAELDALLAALCAEGCKVLEKTDASDYGKFGWGHGPGGQQGATVGGAGWLLVGNRGIL
jgi:hypothetical protein